MAYKAIHIILEPSTHEYSEILIALLDAYKFEGMFERDNMVSTYIPSELYSEDSLNKIKESLLALGCKLKCEIEEIADQNWNSLWESNFEPVVIDTRCTIRAPFHPEFPEVVYQITIEPKMSFGTGHHQTTRLMIEQMLQMEFMKKRVLDMGCGTGILGILASMMGAIRIIAIDTDTWAYHNAKENAARNQINNVVIIQGNSKAIPKGTFDIILVNINRNIILKQFKKYSQHTLQSGLLLLSGILKSDFDVINQEAEKNNFQLLKSQLMDDWGVMLFERK